MNDENTLPKWINRLTRLVHKHWHYHAECSHVNARARQVDKVWELEFSPIFQELYGGDEDGKKVWAGFIFDICNFGREPGIWLKNFAAASFCVNCASTPRLLIQGKFEGHPIEMSILLEPQPDGEVVEILDTISNEVRTPQQEKVEGETSE